MIGFQKVASVSNRLQEKSYSKRQIHDWDFKKRPPSRTVWSKKVTQLEAERLGPRNQKGCYQRRCQRRSLRRYQRRYHLDTSDDVTDDVSADISADISDDIRTRAGRGHDNTPETEHIGDDLPDTIGQTMPTTLSPTLSSTTTAAARIPAGMQKSPYYLAVGRRRPREIEEFLFYEG